MKKQSSCKLFLKIVQQFKVQPGCHEFEPHSPPLGGLAQLVERQGITKLS
jgi:quinol monooxygenase YgiN